MNKMFRRVALVFGVSASLAVVFGFKGVASVENQRTLTASRVPGELVVKLREQGAGKRAQSSFLMALADKMGENAISDVRRFVTDKSLYTVRLADDRGIKAAYNLLAANDAIEYVEPNYLYHAMEAGIPDDAEFAKLWGLHNTGQTDAAGQIGLPGADINVLPLWQQNVTGSRDIVVAIIDTGVDWNHPDLIDNIYTNPKEIPDNGIDDDGNGFIDDVHGWNFAAKNNNSIDDNDHGSHCAGTIGGVGNNGLGVAGVNWKVSILPIKFLTASGSGSLQDAIEAINYVRTMKPHLVSNSWGGGSFSRAMKDAIEAVRDAGILFVAAAGNNGSDNDSSPSYPASYEVDNIVSVAATDNRDQLASFSNYGRTKVHVAAPGVKIFSTVKDGKFGAFSGTSMATPHVSGVAALLFSGHPGITYAEVKERLIRTSTPIRALKRKVAAQGRINAYNAFNNIIPPSDEPDEALWQTVEYALESEHPYQNNADTSFTIQYPGAEYIRLIFDEFDLEQNYDKVILSAPNGEVVETITGKSAEYKTEYVKADTVTVRLKTDASVTRYGFKISKIQVIMKQ